MTPITDFWTISQLSPVQVVGLTCWGEARGASSDLRRAIASTIVNRVNAQRARWGLTPAAVCLAHAQYSCWQPLFGESNYQSVIAAAKALISENASSGTTIGPILRECLGIATLVVGGRLADTVSGATHYYAPASMVPKDRVPDWAVGLASVATVDGTLFYAGVA